jgi:hypothetical protein
MVGATTRRSDAITLMETWDSTAWARLTPLTEEVALIPESMLNLIASLIKLRKHVSLNYIK